MRPRAYSYLRMSTDIQLKGDSRRRQLEASSTYAEAHGLELAREDQLEDIGISAFKGANVKEGALGRFLEAVESDSVPTGSYLLVESLDRISRQKISAGLTLFLRIINAGINVVTLTDKRVYRAGEPDLTDLIVSLVTMSRAHEESLVKSQRLGAAWKNKRNQAVSGRPMTKWAPAWLTLSPDRERFEPILERVAVVRSIFEEAAAGIGMYRIAVRLNDSQTPTFNPSNGWHQSYVAKILSNRAVLGEFQPHKRDNDGKHVPDGEPIEGYFPAVVDRDLFFRAQNGKKQRRVNGAGRKGADFANLFGGLAACAYCGSAMKFENKGPGRKGGTYLICNDAKRRLGCMATRWKYRDFEASFLAFVQELDLDSIINVSDDAAARKALEDERSTLQGELLSLTLASEQTFASLAAGGPVEFLTGKLTDIAARSSELKALLEVNEDKRQNTEAKRSRLVESRDEIRALVGRLQGETSDELYKLRAQIASRLRTLVVSLRIAPMGNVAPPSPEMMATKIGEIFNSSDELVTEFMTRVAEISENTGRRYFAVRFENAANRIVYPRYNDPLRYEMQIEKTKAGFIVDREAETQKEINEASPA